MRPCVTRQHRAPTQKVPSRYKIHQDGICSAAVWQEPDRYCQLIATVGRCVFPDGRKCAPYIGIRELYMMLSTSRGKWLRNIALHEDPPR
jgi:hypothetical protein